MKKIYSILVTIVFLILTASCNENFEIADNECVPICQDTGMACVFLEIGQDVHMVGGDLADAINEGVRRGYD